MKKTLLLVCFLALCNLTLFAQTGERPRTVHTEAKSAKSHVPPQETEAVPPLKTIYSNLGPSLNAYTGDGGWYLSGPNPYGPVFIAMTFTPKKNSTVTQVQAAVQWSGGDNQVNLSIYADNGSNAPGTLLAGPVTVPNLPDYGTCCLLATANFSPTVSVLAGIQYWVVADEPSSGPGANFLGSWNFVVKPNIPLATSYGDGWYAANGDDRPAGRVRGTIP